MYEQLRLWRDRSGYLELSLLAQGDTSHSLMNWSKCVYLPKFFDRAKVWFNTALATMHLIMSSAQVICCVYLLTLLTNASVEANSVDLKEQADLGAYCLTKSLLKHFSR